MVLVGCEHALQLSNSIWDGAAVAMFYGVLSNCFHTYR